MALLAGCTAVVHGGSGHDCLGDPSVPGTVEVAGLNWCAVTGGEHEVVVLPRLGGSLLVTIMLRSSELEGRADDGWEWQRGAGGFGFGLSMKKLGPPAISVGS
jgi:hypothetical protein